MVVENRILHYWNKNGTEYKVFPTSVPLNQELTRLGYTKVTKKVVGPEWRPTKKRRERASALIANINSNNTINVYLM